MTLSVFQSTVTNDSGDVQAGAEVSVINEATGTPAPLYSTRAGAATTNPMFADADGFAQFYTVPGEYRITATSGVFSKTWRYVRIGDAGGKDAATVARNGDYMAYGGTANAITLTSASVLSSSVLSVGDKFRFTATTANTGSATIAVDGGTAISCVLPSGENVSAGYIFGEMEAIYNGANFVLLNKSTSFNSRLSDYTVYGGTANAITLTSAVYGQNPALVKGMKFRFEATATNTGATTIAVDGGSAIACVTPTGVALPAGFIRTDVFTECEYDGANFVVSRKVESGSNANGLWTRWEDGRQVVNHEVTVGAANVAKGSIFSSASASVWTYPVPFINNQHSVSGSIPDVGGWVNATLGNGTTTANIILWKAQSSGDTEQCFISATGKWY